MKYILIAFLTIFSLPAFADGIHFTEGSWADVLKLAKKEKKMVYVDVFATWCGPCKLLDKNIFPNNKVGAFYNKNFVSYHLDAEKGEGLAIAKKYRVSGYPAHLFIDPKNEELVYKGMGYSPDIRDFIKHGQLAIDEHNDPMSWEKYQSKFERGKRSEKFLKSYLQKAGRVDEENNEIINEYVKALGSNISNDDLDFLAQEIKTLGNDAVPLVVAKWKTLSRDKWQEKKELVERWIYATNEQAIYGKDEQLLKQAQIGYQTYMRERVEENILNLATQYYTGINDKDKAAFAARSEAAFLIMQDDGYFQLYNDMAIVRYTAVYSNILKEQNIPENEIPAMVKANVEATPALKKEASLSAANKINNVAWNAYVEMNDAGNTDDLKTALAWAKRAVELSEEDPETWTTIADTYAHLLFLDGKKEEALALETQATELAQKNNYESHAALFQSLVRMKERL